MSLDPQDLEHIRLIANNANETVLAKLAEGDEKFRTHADSLARHDKVLFGNGTPGLVQVSNDSAAFIRNRRWLEKAIVSALIVVMIPGAIAAMVYLIRAMSAWK